MRLLGRFLPKAVRFTAAGGLLLFSLSCLAQQDIRISQTGPAKTLARNRTWNTAGGSGLTNNYIYTPAPGAVGTCFMVQRAGGATPDSLLFTVFGTADTQQIPFTGSGQVGWFPLTTVSPVAGTVTIASPAGTTQIYARIAGTAQVVFSVVTGGTGGGTASIFAVDSSGSDSPCRGGIYNTVGNPNVPTIFQCDSHVTVSATASATTATVPLISGQTTYICGLTYTVSSALTGSNITLVAGTGATCGTGTHTLWGPVSLGSTVGSTYGFGGTLGIMAQSASSERVCTTAAYTAGTVNVTIWYSAVIDQLF